MTRKYDREYRRPVAGPLQIRIGVSTDRGSVTRFLVQLEYWLDGDWRAVVRYDHDPEASEEMAHDVTVEGLHVDIYRDGDKVKSEGLTGPLPAAVAFNHAEAHLTEHLETIVRRFERWHEIERR